MIYLEIQVSNWQLITLKNYKIVESTKFRITEFICLWVFKINSNLQCL